MLFVVVGLEFQWLCSTCCIETFQTNETPTHKVQFLMFYFVICFPAFLLSCGSVLLPPMLQ